MKPLLAFLALPVVSFAAAPVSLHWLDGAAPTAPNGVTWGVPWPKGQLRNTDSLAVTSAAGTSLPVQSWPLAFWPDGSIKWSGHAIAVDSASPGTVQLVEGPPSAPAQPLRVTDTAESITIDAGVMQARIAKHGSDLLELSTAHGTVARHGRLVVIREDRSQLATSHVRREEAFLGAIDAVELERNGPVSAVVKITGRHRASDGDRAWLPFTVRLAFFAGSPAAHLTHSFVFDGDAHRDFIRGIGLAFEVPFREETHNRHLRFATDADTESPGQGRPGSAIDGEHSGATTPRSGLWRQPVRMLPGYRAQAGGQIAALYADHLDGKRVPNLADLEARTRDALLTVPVWSDAKLVQLSPNGWSIFKRTSAEASWLHVTDGQRAQGLVAIGDVSGTLAVGTKDFWQKAPASLEITGASGAAAQLKIWFWSPDAEPMDLRRYDEVPHGLAINYEDWKPGWGTPVGIGNTHDVTLWVFSEMPTADRLTTLAALAARPPHLVCRPEYYHHQQVFGFWSLPDRSTPALAWIEDQVQGLVDYYRAQVDERSWYGFWDFGDIMHNYDFGRHEWRYDVGGWAWANTELMPDMLLWYCFLRTGRADLFRFAEAMTRHTSEVDVHHVGPFAPLGSRHNVNHWGDGAKQPRISHAGLKRQYYYLTGGDGRIGDLLKEQIDADLTYSYLQQFNGSHYVPAADGSPVLDTRSGGFGGPRQIVAAPRPEQFAARPTAAERRPLAQFGLEWMCYALNWTTEWERGGDQTWRGRVETDMKTAAATVDAQGRFPGRYFDMIFGGPENMAEMEPMYDVPAFWTAWANTCEAIGRAVSGGQMTGPRMLAYAAARKHDPALGRLAWEKLIGPPGKLPPVPNPQRVEGAGLVHPVTDPAFLGASVGWQLHGVASVQWALNAIETMELAKPYLSEWEKAR